MFLFTSPLSLSFLCPSSFPHRENLGDNRHPTSSPYFSHIESLIFGESQKKIPTKFHTGRYFISSPTLSISFSRSSFSLSMPKFRTSTANGYYHSHSKFIVQRVIIMPSFVQYQTTDIMTKSFLMVEMEGRDSRETATSAKQRHKMRERKEDTKFIPLSAGIR